MNAVGWASHCQMHYSDYIPTTDPEVLATLRDWFRMNPEILVRIRRPRSGSEEFEFFSSFEALTKRMPDDAPYTWFPIFQQPQLPPRGIVDDNFIAQCLSAIPDGTEYLIVETVLTVAGKLSWFHGASGESHGMFRDDLEESRETPVAVGEYPDCLEERADVIHAFTLDAAGIVVPGPY